MEGISSGADYRKDRVKEYKLPSGFTFRIRKPNKAVLNDIMEIMQVQFDPEQPELEVEGMNVEQQAKLMDVIISRCIVSPKIVFEYTEKDDELWIEDFDMVDAVDMTNEILQWAGLSEEKIKAALFRGPRTPR